MKICIDPGHGGKQPGAVGTKGIPEKDIVLKVALMVGEHLQRHGVDILYTRTFDEDVSLEKRCDMANTFKADYFISIHANSAENQTANGIETYYYNGSNAGLILARNIQEETVKASGLVDRGLKTNDLYVIRETNMPAALHELAFLSNPKEQDLLLNDKWLAQQAEAIAKGILKTAYISWIPELREDDPSMIDKLIIASGDGDMAAATLAMYEYKAPVILKDYYLLNPEGNKAKEYIVIGGVWEPSEPGAKIIRIAGSDRMDTARKLLNK
ncbi:sporulation-specific N-acetylmuramoyl-L-alanine amidase [Oxobacter pfennigii]|uniref:Sporulation-specific N-acetylmuramoyl-L-alanine amidase n=1 Tax=Oxobacter pfennigii TaxID=36849 RepID=A0A0P9AEB8_9CLOT|nr:N-acetylmuramoyl-L-alanine amidase [Oxobacter pfennigii]KPU43662.1 sporulation-specific N-acetylmuramoyl-L-alanine amidase [Oxobacter pfennigii]